MLCLIVSLPYFFWMIGFVFIYSLLDFELCLGGTPYAEVKSRDIGHRVIRGMRVPQTTYMTDEIYQLMLQCWQLDLDERPNFLQIKDELKRLQDDLTTKYLYHINFSYREQNFEYERYCTDLESLS